MYKDDYSSTNSGIVFPTCLATLWSTKQHHLRNRFSLPRHIVEDNMGDTWLSTKVLYHLPSSNVWPNRSCQQSIGPCSQYSLWAQQTETTLSPPVSPTTWTTPHYSNNNTQSSSRLCQVKAWQTKDIHVFSAWRQILDTLGLETQQSPAS